MKLKLLAAFVFTASSIAQASTLADVTKFIEDNIVNKKFEKGVTSELTPNYAGDGRPAMQVWSRTAQFQNLQSGANSASVDYVVQVHSDYYAVDENNQRTDKKIGSTTFKSTLIFEFRPLPDKQKLVGYVRYDSITNNGAPVDRRGVVYLLDAYLEENDDEKFELHLDYHDPLGSIWPNTAEGAPATTFKARIHETLRIENGELRRNQIHTYTMQDGAIIKSSHNDVAK